MPTKRGAVPAAAVPDIPKEKAYGLLKDQLEKLKAIKEMHYSEGEPMEKEWYQLTSKIVARSFGENSSNLAHLRRGLSAGHYQMVVEGAPENHARNQSNFQERLGTYEAALNSSIAELAIDLGSSGIKGVYAPGQEYEFYADMKTCLSAAKKEILVVEPYPSTELFDVYAQSIPRSVQFRLLTAPSLPTGVKAVAQKYATGGNHKLRTTNSIHDRVLFADDRVWVIGQSMKDAATKKPTYIVEFDESLMRGIYEHIWNGATSVI